MCDCSNKKCRMSESPPKELLLLSHLSAYHFFHSFFSHRHQDVYCNPFLFSSSFCSHHFDSFLLLPPLSLPSHFLHCLTRIMTIMHKVTAPSIHALTLRINSRSIPFLLTTRLPVTAITPFPIVSSLSKMMGIPECEHQFGFVFLFFARLK